MRLAYQFQGQMIKGQGHQAHECWHTLCTISSERQGLRTSYLVLCTDGGRWPASATGAMTFTVKGQGRKVTWSVWAVLVQCVPVSLEAGVGIPCWPNPGATLLVIVFFCYLRFCMCIICVQLSKNIVLPQGPLVYGDTKLDICRSDSVMYFPRYFISAAAVFRRSMALQLTVALNCFSQSHRLMTAS